MGSQKEVLACAGLLLIFRKPCSRDRGRFEQNQFMPLKGARARVLEFSRGSSLIAITKASELVAYPAGSTLNGEDLIERLERLMDTRRHLADGSAGCREELAKLDKIIDGLALWS